MIGMNNIIKTYRNKERKKTYALNDVSVEFCNTGLVFITGESGAGKSTLLNIIGGIDKPNRGDVFLNEQNLRTMSNKEISGYRANTISYIFQVGNLLKNYSVEENIMIGMKKSNHLESIAKCNDLLHYVGLEGYNDRFPFELSIGEQQRVAIVKALLKNSRIMLLDEPTGALDSESKKRLYDLLKELSKDRLIIIVSHDEDTVDEYADRHIHMEKWKIVDDTTFNTTSKLHIENTNHKQNAFLYKNIFSLCLKKLRFNKFRYIMSILVLFSFVSLIAACNSVSHPTTKNIIKTFYKDGVQSVGFEKVRYNEEGEYTSLQERSFTQKMLDDFSMKNEDVDFFGVYRTFEKELPDKRNLTSLDNYIYPDKFYGGVKISDELIEQYSLTLISGNYPTNTLETKEIAISSYMADYFLKVGTLDGESTTYSELIGKRIDLEEVYVISGIVDTNSNMKNSLPIDASIADRVDYETMITSNLVSEVHALIFLSNDYHISNAEVTESDDLYTTQVLTQKMHFNFSTIPNKDVIFIGDNSLDNLDESDVIIEGDLREIYYKITNIYVDDDVDIVPLLSTEIKKLNQVSFTNEDEALVYNHKVNIVGFVDSNRTFSFNMCVSDSALDYVATDLLSKYTTILYPLSNDLETDVRVFSNGHVDDDYTYFPYNSKMVKYLYSMEIIEAIENVATLLTIGLSVISIILYVLISELFVRENRRFLGELVINGFSTVEISLTLITDQILMLIPTFLLSLIGYLVVIHRLQGQLFNDTFTIFTLSFSGFLAMILSLMMISVIEVIFSLTRLKNTKIIKLIQKK